MQLAAYLDRIGFTGDARPDLATLAAIHRAHANTIPFENLDVQLRRPAGLGLEAAYDKIVRRRRGGWCYEMNGVLGWALGEIGFDVKRLTAGVLREKLGDVQLGNHLCLKVQLDEPFLVDVGFGGSLDAPIPLRTIQRRDTPYDLKLDSVDGGFWRYTERAHGDPFGFDFRDGPSDEALMAAKCDYLQTDPKSIFVQNLVAQRRKGDTHISLRGRVLAVTSGAGVDKRLINSTDEFVAELRNSFGLDTPEAATLWPAICARHAELFPDE